MWGIGRALVAKRMGCAVSDVFLFQEGIRVGQVAIFNLTLQSLAYLRLYLGNNLVPFRMCLPKNSNTVGFRRQVQLRNLTYDEDPALPVHFFVGRD